MSVTNGERLVTKQDLKDFYDGILPYLGSSADAGFTPVGTVISVMGVTAPANYLICDGTVYNIADYPELAEYFNQQFGSKNNFGGNGTTTFAVPDLRGEFLRGTGTNSHTNQGDGASVGVHQDGTELPLLVTADATGRMNINYKKTNSEHYTYANKADKIFSDADNYTSIFNNSQNVANPNTPYLAITRPTNTSVLYCIATKNIYMNPSLDYSTTEKVVGTWIDSKPIYQKTIVIGTMSATSTEKYQSLNTQNVDKLIKYDGVYFEYSDNNEFEMLFHLANSRGYVCPYKNKQGNNLYAAYKLTDTIYNVFVTVQYTKTTD